MRVEVVYALPGEARVATVELKPGATVRDAVAAAGFPATENVGVFGKRVRADHRLSQGERVEIYRPLEVDPKEARRRRASRKR
jgi:putative ubiquitin-RnfH superfamily antitoxin RatB of RatAB toxin-antitoxin module